LTNLVRRYSNAVSGILRVIGVRAIRRLAATRRIPDAHQRNDLENELCASFGDDVAGLLRALSREEIIAALNPAWPLRSGHRFLFTFLGLASDDELRVVATRFFLQGWWPQCDGDSPLPASKVATTILAGLADHGDGSHHRRRRGNRPRDDAQPRMFPDEFSYSEKYEILPRPYQAEAVSSAVSAISAANPQLVHIPTGGGKTIVGNGIATSVLADRGGYVLWVTKDWALLEQAAKNRAKSVKGSADTLARFGGAGSVLDPLRDVADGPLGSATVVFSTVQTIAQDSRLTALLHKQRPSLVVVDECDWGELGKWAGRLLDWCEKFNVPVLGLTATPRPAADSRFRVAYSIDHATLVDLGFLARHELVTPVETGRQWKARLAADHLDFRPDSLRELGRDSVRNNIIVKHYTEHAESYGQTIVFCCSIEHATNIANLLTKRGIAARPVHSNLPEAQNEETLRQFRNGEVKVIANVAMLTRGHDFPSTRTVFLCRPTVSEVLFEQMVGRGCRLDPATDKTSYAVVDFVDNSSFRDQLVTPKRFFTGCSRGARSNPTATRPSDALPTAQHSFDVNGRPLWTPDGPSIPESLRGLWLREGQTYGVEIELTDDDFPTGSSTEGWARKAEGLRVALEKALGCDRVAQAVQDLHGECRNFSVWNVEPDNSAGWEVKSRILRDLDGLREIDQACVAITKAAVALGLKVNCRTGIHFHLGWSGRSVTEVKRLIQLFKVFEPAIATLVAPSRVACLDRGTYEIGSPNQYCAPVSTVFSLETLRAIHALRDVRRRASDDGARYVTLNVGPLDTIGTVEVRLFSGSTDSGKILLWLSLSTQILSAASGDTPIPDVADCAVITPTADIIELARVYLPPDQGRMHQRLHERRWQVLEIWKKHPELAAWVDAAKNWKPPHALKGGSLSPTRRVQYFAYGSNMSPEILCQRCPSARSLGSGRLHGYALAFAGASRRWKGGVATIVPCSGGHVDGVIYEITMVDLDALDHVEGADYKRTSLSVQGPSGPVNVQIYFRPAEPTAFPSRAYYNILRAQYRLLGFDIAAITDAMADVGCGRPILAA